MKVTINYDEYYPFYLIDPEHSGMSVDVPEDVAERWKRVMAEFDLVQDEMEKAYNKAK